MTKEQKVNRELDFIAKSSVIFLFGLFIAKVFGYLNPIVLRDIIKPPPVFFPFDPWLRHFELQGSVRSNQIQEGNLQTPPCFQI